MKKINYLTFVILMLFGISSCSKEEVAAATLEEAEFLKFEISPKDNQKGKVLYSKWLKSQFPSSSKNNSEFFSLPFIKKEFFDADKDLLLVYGKRNTIFNLPVTIPASLESYAIELLPNSVATTVRLSVYSLNLEALQDIFFRATAESQFRVVIIPAEKLLTLKSKSSIDFEKMTYQELREHFVLPE